MSGLHELSLCIARFLPTWHTRYSPIRLPSLL